jgi:hypothetical protein
MPPAQRPPADDERAGDGEHELDRLRAAKLRLAGGPLAHVDRDLLDTEAGLAEADQRLDLGRAGQVGLRQELDRGGVRGVHPARRVADRAAGPHLHRPPENGSPEPARGRRQVAVRRVALTGDEARADGDVALAGLHAVEQPLQLVRRMLAVRVDPPAEPVAAFVGPAPAGGDRVSEAAILREGEHLGARRPRSVGGAVGRAVVDDEDVGVRQLLLQLRQHRRQRIRLVPGRYEHQGLRHVAP